LEGNFACPYAAGLQEMFDTKFTQEGIAYSLPFPKLGKVVGFLEMSESEGCLLWFGRQAKNPGPESGKNRFSEKKRRLAFNKPAFQKKKFPLMMKLNPTWDGEEP